MSIYSGVRGFRARFSRSSPDVIWTGIAAVALTTIVALPGFAQAQQTLSLNDALRIAVERSRQIAARDSSIVALKEMGAAAGQLPDPILKLGVDNLPVDGADRYSIGRDFMTMRRIGLMQEITRGDKRKLKTERF